MLLLFLLAVHMSEILDDGFDKMDYVSELGCNYLFDC